MNIRRENHHYWPKSLSQFWGDEKGRTTRLSWDGTEVRSTPKNFGAIGDGHTVRVEGPWANTIEPIFQRVDHKFPDLVGSLLEFEARINCDNALLFKRFYGYTRDKSYLDWLGESLASLLARSPMFRNKLAVTTDYYRQGLPYRDKTDRENLIVMNLHQSYKDIVRAFQGGGKFLLLFSVEREFIFADGFWGNISSINLGTRKCLIPILPTLAVGYFRPTNYISTPNIITINLSDQEVATCNNISQVYTKDYVYYRSMKPDIIE